MATTVPSVSRTSTAHVTRPSCAMTMYMHAVLVARPFASTATTLPDTRDETSSTSSPSCSPCMSDAGMLLSSAKNRLLTSQAVAPCGTSKRKPGTMDCSAVCVTISGSMLRTAPNLHPCPVPVVHGNGSVRP